MDAGARAPLDLPAVIRTGDPEKFIRFESFRHVPAIVVLVEIILISHSGFAGTSLILMQFLLFQVPVVS